MSEFDWWVARSLDEARRAMAADCGAKDMADAERHQLFDKPRPITNEELDSLRYYDSGERDQPIGRGRTFRNELRRRIAEGLQDPELFATTEI